MNSSTTLLARLLLVGITPIFSARTLALESPPKPLAGGAAALFAQAETDGRWFADVMRLNPEIIPTTDGRSFWVVWRVSPTPSKWIVSLHGAGRPAKGYATDDLAVWRRHLVGRDVGIACLQWWLGAGDEAEDFLTPQQIYREIDAEMKALNAKPGNVMLHGFSRGSANSYAVAAIDAGIGRNYFSLCVASSGRYVANYPPNQALVAGDYGDRPLDGTRWITVAGAHDKNPGQSGFEGMRATSHWLQGQGAIVVEMIEDEKSGHGALHLNPENCQRVLDEFLTKP